MHLRSHQAMQHKWLKLPSTFSETKTKEETEDLTDVLAAGKYIARRDAEALRLLAQ